MTREPSFVLASGSAVVAEGVHTAFPSVADARAALRSHSTPIIVGALPFDMSKPAALIRPQEVQFLDALPAWPLRTLPTVTIAETRPDPGEHRARIAAALTRLRDPGGRLQKVVLARALRLVTEGRLDARTIVDRLTTADPAANAYIADLTAAGGPYSGTVLVGASPELLVARHGDRVVCAPFAGSAPRLADREADEASGAALAASAKNRHEHQLVIDAMREVLDPLCVDLDITAEPKLSKTAAVWHLKTLIHGRLREKSTTALDLALALHHTPAVGGVPAREAAELIAEIEGDRGFYAGAVG
ncbi:MAG TPA: chorismate-binding protein, partial [Mycobacterium sp.]|nr:chorismate-binding protein [Mycobacterium sp.]